MKFAFTDIEKRIDETNGRESTQDVGTARRDEEDDNKEEVELMLDEKQGLTDVQLNEEDTLQQSKTKSEPQRKNSIVDDALTILTARSSYDGQKSDEGQNDDDDDGDDTDVETGHDDTTVPNQTNGGDATTKSNSPDTATKTGKLGAFQSRRMILLLVLSLVAIVLVGLLIKIVLDVTGKEKIATPNTLYPSTSPTIVMTSSPTSVAENDRLHGLAQILGLVVNELNSNELKALKWMAWQDPALDGAGGSITLENTDYLSSVSPPISTTVMKNVTGETILRWYKERYLIALFYFATSGDHWYRLGRGAIVSSTTSSSAISSTDRNGNYNDDEYNHIFLSGESICEWNSGMEFTFFGQDGIYCNNDGFVTAIVLGTCIFSCIFLTTSKQIKKKKNKGKMC